MPKLKIALIDDDHARADYIRKSLLENDFEVVACLTLDHLNIFRLEHLQADVILLDMDHPHRDIIESCVSSYDLPTVLFTKIQIKTPSNKPSMRSNGLYCRWHRSCPLTYHFRNLD